jgi:hypothetical protein
MEWQMPPQSFFMPECSPCSPNLEAADTSSQTASSVKEEEPKSSLINFEVLKGHPHEIIILFVGMFDLEFEVFHSKQVPIRVQVPKLREGFQEDLELSLPLQSPYQREALQMPCLSQGIYPERQLGQAS